MEKIHILRPHTNKTPPEDLLNSLPCCPVCGAKAYLKGDAPGGYWFGWSVGCPKCSIDDGVHGMTFDTPKGDFLVGHGFDTSEEAAEWWKNRVERWERENGGADR